MLVEALGVTEEMSDAPIVLDGQTIFVDILLDHKLIVEVDGPDHAQRTKRAADKVRDAKLATFGYSVLRLWRWDVEERLSEMVAQVRLAMATRAKHRIA